MIINKSTIIDFKNTPINVSEKIWEGYKDLYPNIDCEDNGENLVDVKDYGIKGLNYYYKRGITPNYKIGGNNKEMVIYQNKYFSNLINHNLLDKRCFLRRGVVDRLVRLNEELKNYGLEILIMSGYRAPLLQIIAKEVFEKFHGKELADLMFAKARSGPHCSGGAFDIEIIDRLGNILPTKFKDKKNSMGSMFGEELLIRNKNLKTEDIEVIKNRRLLHHLMKVFEFTYHYYEYWHYGNGDLLSTYIYSKEFGTNLKAKYKLINYSDYTKNLKNLAKI